MSKSPITNWFSRWIIRLFKLIIMGVIAGAIMDLWNLALDISIGVTLDWHLLGRWIGHTLQGDFVLYNIPKLSAIPYESILGWYGHYLTSIVYMIIYLFVIYKILNRKPTLLNALITAWCFMIMPFCLYQPAIGLGYFGAQAPNPNMVRLITFSMHTAFGIGLYLGYIIMHSLHRVIPFSKKDR